ncbi:FMN-binding negative transcriptional regulator [Sphingomonadaceae bacterium jetA1]|jgi:transcriptional regulator|uniref:FMN-binding negative transcriptional regulator n=1 Tax=Facivitalis istanbulensis TaxID=3075838 RepID=UPI0034881558
MNTAAQPSVANPVSQFQRFSEEDVRALIAEFPLAWVSTPGGTIGLASQLPLVGEYDVAGRLVALIGHLPRANPLADALASQARATILFSGPSGYVSPEHAGRRDWAPTWNYAQAKVEADVEISADLTALSLDVLIDACEGGRANPWTVGEIAARYQGMAAAIIGFRATVTALQGRFKLGQDERPDTLRHILATHPDPVLVRWMRRFNREA